jgi:hypothetical protein
VVTFSNSTSSSYYNITSATVNSLSNATTSPPVGAFWVFRNNTTGMLTLTLDSFSATYNGTNAFIVSIASGNSLTLVPSGSLSNFIVF